MVVRGQGELTIVEVAGALSSKQPLQNIAGLSWKSNGQRHHNVDRKVEPLDALPIPAFDLTDFDAYEKLCGVRSSQWRRDGIKA
jgi:anaerobic magnesium-protoporphyrin IX monomethyl ester cyclase